MIICNLLLFLLEISMIFFIQILHIWEDMFDFVIPISKLAVIKIDTV